MKIISNNPYRTIGLLADCTERDIQKQKGLIKRYLDVGKEIFFDNDVILHDDCQRDSQSVQTAFAKIEQVKSRINSGLFWFVSGTHIDEPALSYLYEGENDKAIEIWSNVVNGGEVTAKNCFAIHNLSTLKMGLAFYDDMVDKNLFAEGMLLKASLLNSEFANNIIKRVADETYQLDSLELQKTFVDEVLSNIAPYLDSRKGISSNDLAGILNSMPSSLRTYASKKFLEKPIHVIETAIKESERQRKISGANIFGIASKLAGDTTAYFDAIRSIAGQTNLQYTLLSDKVAEELLRCSTDYFNALRDSSTDPGAKSLQITKLAQARAISSKIKEKIQKDIEYLNKWNADKPIREKEKKIEAEYDLILTILEEYDSKPETIENAKSLVNRSLLTLQKIRATLGSTDDLYLKLSSRIGSEAQSMVVAEVNKAQDTFIKRTEHSTLYFDRNTLIQELRQVFEAAWKTTTLIGSLDMNSDFRDRYNKNKTTLQGLCTQIGIGTSAYSSSGQSRPVSPRPASSSTSNSGSGDNSGAKAIIWIIGIILFFLMVKACNS